MPEEIPSSRSLRILTVANVPPDPNSGAAGTVYHTNVALRELGHDVDEVWAGDLGRHHIQHGNLHALLEQPRLYRRAVLDRIAKQRYDVIQMSQPQAYLAARALKQRRFAGLVINRSHGLELRVNAVVPAWRRKLGVRESQFPRALFTPLLRRLLERHWHAAARYCDGFILPCNDDRDFLIARLPIEPERARVIHHGIPAVYVDTPLPPPDPARRFRLLYVGQYAFIKGPHVLASVLMQVLRDEPRCTMTWVCAKKDHPVVRSMISGEIAERLTLSDWLPQDELLRVYDDHGIFIFPSFYEGAGKASLEALSRGLCVVASDTSGMKDYIRHGHNGYLCPIGESAAFVNSIRSQLVDETVYLRVCAQSRRSAMHLRWSKCAAEAVRFYREMAGRTSGIS